MSKTQYYKNLVYSELSLKKINFPKEEFDNNTDLKNNKDTIKAKDSWKIFMNLKNLKTQSNNKMLLSRNKFQKNKSYIPLIKNKISIIHTNKAPSLFENRKEMVDFIKKEKLKQKQEIDNLYNTLLVNESKLFRTGLYLTKTPVKLSHCNSIANFNINKNKKFTTFHQSKINNEITGSTSIENIKNNFEKSNSMININSNETKLFLPGIDKNKTNSNNISSKVNHNLFFKTISQTMFDEITQNENNNSYSKIRQEINEMIFNNLKRRYDFSQIGKKIMKLKVIGKIQNNKLQDILSQEIYNYDKKYDKLIKLRKIDDNVYIEFAETMNNYLKFLSDKIYDCKKELSLYYRQIKELDEELEIIIIKIVKYQTDLEYLVERRNFLLLIKDKLSKPPSYYEEILVRDSKKLLVGDAICNLKVTKLIKNKNVMVFNDSYLETKEKISENLLDINHILDGSKNSIIDKQIFGSVDDFIQLYKKLENKYLKYLKQLDDIRKQKDILQKQYEQLNQLNKGYLDEEIINKEEKLEKLIKKNEVLLTTFNYYKDIIIKSFVIKKNTSTNIYNNTNSNEKKISSIDLNTMKKYYEQLEKYKYDGLLLLHKLIELLKNLSHIKYDKSNYLSKIFDDKNLMEILSFNFSKFTKEKIYYINNYIITLISKYEIICKYIINKNEAYSRNKKIKEFIKEKRMKLILIKKKENSEILRKIINNKKFEDMKKIIEKTSKITSYIPNKVCPENSAKRNKALGDIQKKILLDIKSNFLENEFNGFVNYAD